MQVHWARVAIALLLGTSALPAKAVCNRACLAVATDNYLRALRDNAPSRAGLASNARLVENGDAIVPGDGVWRGGVRLRSRQMFIDPADQQVAFYGAAEIGGRLSSYFQRLKFVDGRVAESEIFSKGGEPGTAADASALLEPDVLYEAAIPLQRRNSRGQLTQIVTDYLEGISKHDPRAVAFHPRCDRYSAGQKFTNNPEQHPIDKGGGSCAQSLMRLTGQAVEDTRLSVIDEALGVVVVEFIIPHAERPQKGATNVAEVFKVVDGKIRSIEEFAFGGKFPVTSGFGPGRRDGTSGDTVAATALAVMNR